MPQQTYTATIDGKDYSFESDHEPSYNDLTQIRDHVRSQRVSSSAPSQNPSSGKLTPPRFDDAISTAMQARTVTAPPVFKPKTDIVSQMMQARPTQVPVEPTQKQKTAAQVKRLAAELGMTVQQAKKFGAGNPGRAQELIPGAQNPDMPQAQYLVNRDLGSIEKLDPNPSETLTDLVAGPGGAKALAEMTGPGATATRAILSLLDPQSQVLAVGAGGASALSPAAGRAVSGLFAGGMGVNAAQQAASGDIGGAAVTGGLALLPGLHAAGAKAPKLFRNSPKEQELTVPAPGKILQRFEEIGQPLSSADKPHGLYTNSAEYPSPHSDLGGTQHLMQLSPDAKVLDVPPYPGAEVAMRKGAVDAGAGVHAARHILGKEPFDVLKGLPKTDLENWASERFPGTDFSKYHDRQEIMEGVGGMLAREAGHDAFHVADSDPAWSETVVLNQKSIKPLSDGAGFVAPEAGSGVRPMKTSSLNAQIIPGLDKFFAEDVQGKAVPAVKNAFKAVKDSLSPSTSSPEAANTANSFRHAGAEFARKQVIAEDALKSAKKYTVSLDPADQLSITHAIETGAKITDPKLVDFVSTMRDLYQDRIDRIQKMGGLTHLIDNYMPHIWKDPNRAADYYAGIGSKRPLEGSKAFLKQRSIPTTLDGIAAGLEPVTTDPVELTMLKLREMDRYILGQDVFRDMKANGTAKFYRPGNVPDGWVKLDDRIAKVTQAVPTTNAAGDAGAPLFVDRGAYYAPEDAARVFNNHLSPGLRGNAAYDLAAAVNNSLNQAQLGLSGFHLTFTAVDATVGKLALAGEYLSQGKVGKAAVTAAKAITPLYSPIENVLAGNKIAKAYRNPALATGDMAKMIDALQAGGGRVHMDSFYKNSSVESFWKALKTGNYPGAALRAFPAAIETAAKPLMEFTVPRMKLGAFSDLARMEMERLPAGASIAEKRAVMGRAWDSVDNRLGQMVYDNLFWNKTLKDLGMISTRSLGWNLGTIRELGGSLVDAGGSIKRIKGGGPLITHRMAYAAALPATVALYGAMYQYMMTGKGPEELKDYFQPQTNAEGDRIVFPSYLKDIEHYYTKPGETISHKIGPLWSSMMEMMRNEDFYGNEIKNHTDPLIQQAGQEAAYLAGQYVPFGFKSNPNQKHEEDIATKARRFMGLLPASKEYSESQLARMKGVRELKKAKDLQYQGR